MKYNLGIRAQLIAGIVITTLAGIGFIGVIAISIVESNVLYHKVKEAEKVARIIRSAVDEGSSRWGKAEALDYAESIMRDGRIQELVFYKASKVAGAEDRPYSEPMVSIDGELVYFEDNIRIWRTGGRWLDKGTALKVMLGGGRASPASIIATFTVPLSDVVADMASMRRFVFFYAVVDSIIIIVLGIYFLSRYIVTPIKRLEGAAMRISGGDFDERADVVYDNEVGRLAGAFNTMAERLKGEIKGLERANMDLMDAQERLLVTSKLAAVGRLAAGLAHEIGNPLGAVRGYLDLLSRKDEPNRLTPSEESEIIERTDKEISRIDKIVKEFLDLARPSKEPPSKLDVNALVEETAAMIEHHDGLKGVSAKLELNRDIPPVIIDEGKLRQVFLNLLINAAEAMGEGGKVTIRTEVVERTETGGSVSVERRATDRGTYDEGARKRRAKRYVSISFRDTGCGIEDKDMDKIFDPFFTTKETGSGTGLGLFVSRSIIETFGGFLEMDSRLGEGTEFRVILPGVVS